jgi:hypothetical protein
LTVAFAFLAGMTLVSALGVVLSRSVVHSALFMSGSFLGISGYFVMLNAPALAAFQVLIYVGAASQALPHHHQPPVLARFPGRGWRGMLSGLCAGGRELGSDAGRERAAGGRRLRA